MAISIAKTIMALGIMVFATLKAIREVWFTGAVIPGIDFDSRIFFSIAAKR